MKLIERTHYLDQLKQVKDIPDIKVITGVRRSGKSKLMDAFIETFKDNNNANIIRIKLNLDEFKTCREGEGLLKYVIKHFKEDKSNYLFIDEIQLCKDFEWAVNSLHEEEKYDIYLTGSNAFLLSSDLATLFGGRVFEISVYPFSFKEFLKYYPSDDIDKAFEDYFKKGGMSGSYLYKTEEDAKKYVNNIYRTTIIKDVIKKYNLANEDLLIMIANFLMDNIGSCTSIRNIARKLTSSSYKTNDKTVGSYIACLCKAFLFYPMQRYDIQGKKYLETDMKYYLADLSFRYSELGTKHPDYGHLYENLVALELRRRGYEVYVGQLYSNEIDFVAIKNGEKLYIQVSDDISNDATFQREIKPLLAIKDAFPKMIIAKTKHETTQHEGIQIIDIAKWLSPIS